MRKRDGGPVLSFPFIQSSHAVFLWRGSEPTTRAFLKPDCCLLGGNMNVAVQWNALWRICWAFLYPRGGTNDTRACVWKLYSAPNAYFATTRLFMRTLGVWAGELNCLRLAKDRWRIWHPEFALNLWKVTGNTSFCSTVCLQAPCSLVFHLSTLHCKLASS